MAARHLFTVTETFPIADRGTVVIGFTKDQYQLFRVGDSVELKRPDGTLIRAQVTGKEYPPSVIWLRERPPNPRYGLLVSAGPDEVPVGTEVWSATESQ